MRAGRLRHRVELQEPLQEQDAAGQPISTWRTVGRRWASVEPLTGQELLRAQQFGAETTIRVRMRFMERLTPKWRLRHEGRTLEIVSLIDRGERGRELELLCKEIA